jgi:hypothetical protein
LQLAGTSIPLTDIRGGRFGRHGTRTSLSFEHRGRVLTLLLDRETAGYDVVAIGDDPVAVAAEIESAGR